MKLKQVFTAQNNAKRRDLMTKFTRIDYSDLDDRYPVDLTFPYSEPQTSIGATFIDPKIGSIVLVLFDGHLCHGHLGVIAEVRGRRCLVKMFLDHKKPFLKTAEKSQISLWIETEFLRKAPDHE